MNHPGAFHSHRITIYYIVLMHCIWGIHYEISIENNETREWKTKSGQDENDQTDAEKF